MALETNYNTSFCLSCLRRRSRAERPTGDTTCAKYEMT
jgi:hypothetical protein